MAKVRLITHKGKTDTMMGWAKAIGISNVTLRMRLDAGWSVKRSLETPVQPRKKSKPRKPKLILPLRTYQHEQRQLALKLRMFIQRALADRGQGDNFPKTSSDRCFSSAQDI
jgi:hypothetical protein